MREKLRNDILLVLNEYLEASELQEFSIKLELILSDYEIENHKTEIISRDSIIPKTVEIYIVSKKISGLSDKSLYLYFIVLSDFFRTVQKVPEKLQQII